MSNIFCMEGDWSYNLADKSSVRPLLDLLQGINEVKYIHRHVGTETELRYYTERWVENRYKAYNIGYFAFHGIEGGLGVANDKYVPIEVLGEILEGKCSGKMIYFGSCSVLSISEERLSRFKKQTKAACVCGYTKEVEWVLSASFDMLLFDAFGHYENPRRTMDYLKKTVPGLLVNLDFRMQ